MEGKLAPSVRGCCLEVAAVLSVIFHGLLNRHCCMKSEEVVKNCSSDLPPSGRSRLRMRTRSSWERALPSYSWEAHKHLKDVERLWDVNRCRTWKRTRMGAGLSVSALCTCRLSMCVNVLETSVLILLIQSSLKLWLMACFITYGEVSEPRLALFCSSSSQYTHTHIANADV